MQFFEVILKCHESAVNLPPDLDAFLCILLTDNTEITTEYRHRDRRLE